MDVRCSIAVFILLIASTLYANAHEASTSTAEAEASRLIVSPAKQSAMEGDAVDFICRANFAEGLQYSWLQNGQPVRNTSRIYQTDASLRIENVQYDVDAGDYICIVTSTTSGARVASPPARLSVIWMRTVTVELVNNSPDQLVLKCHVKGSSGDGMFEIEWFRNSEKLSTLKNIQLQQNKLIVWSPSIEDNGLYRCIATNAAGRAMSKKGVVYHWTDAGDKYNLSESICAPRIKKNMKLSKSLQQQQQQQQTFLCRGKRGGAGGSLPEDKLGITDVNIMHGPSGKKIVKENDPIELPCSYSLPEKYRQLSDSVQLRWRKDGKIFRHIELNHVVPTTTEPNKDVRIREDGRVTINRQTGSLIFSNVIASDAGHFVCQIYIDGQAPITSDVGELEVLSELKFVPQPTSKNLELGSVGKVHCKAQGTPTPLVKWLKNLNSLLPDTIDDINGTLIFRNVSTEHQGNYTCMASNSQGQISATVAINVVVAPRFSVAPEGPVETIESGVAVMHCQAIGDPKPTIKWDKDLQYLSENNTDSTRFRFLDNGTLEIHDVQLDDEGRYGCTIGNSAGLKREEVRFTVKPSNLEEDSADGFLITRAVLITMSVAFAYIILVVGLMIWCRYRRQARKARLGDGNRDNMDSMETGKNAENEPCLPETHDQLSSKSKKINGNNNPRGSGNEAQKSDDTGCSTHSKTSKKSHAYDQLSLPRSGISELIQIGRGEFGDVFVGKIKPSIIRKADEKDNETEKSHGNDNGVTTSSNNIEKRRSKTSMDDIEEIKEEPETGSSDADTTTDEYKLVLIKALNKIKDETICQEFKRQIDLFRSVSHKGVVRLYGLCREKDPHYIVLEYTDWGDLKQFLLATAGKVNTSGNSCSPPPLKIGQILAVAYQIARGMDAIYRARYIHKDLATRNCVISSDFVVKVSYPALCKDKYNREYFKHRNTLLPIRWLAPECIQEDEYTTKSDIFAFGVVVWELFHQATKIPFEDLSNEDVLLRSQTGKLEWACADNTPECLQEILTSCWRTNPKERPSFSQLCAALSKAMQKTEK